MTDYISMFSEKRFHIDLEKIFIHCHPNVLAKCENVSTDWKKAIENIRKSKNCRTQKMIETITEKNWQEGNACIRPVPLGKNIQIFFFVIYINLMLLYYTYSQTKQDKILGKSQQMT